MRTKRENEVMELSGKLPPISGSQREYAMRHSGSYVFAYYRKGYCSECGGLVIDGRCTDCGIRFPKKAQAGGRCRAFYYGIITASGKYQVLRNFVVEKTARRGCEPEYRFHECFQNWLDDRGRETVVARRRIPCSYDNWIFDSEMEVRRRSRHSYYSPYDISPRLTYPWKKVSATVRRNGFTGDFHGVSPLDLFRMLLTDNLAETLVKTGRGHMLSFGMHTLHRHARELAICHRHGYEIEDLSLWTDMVRLGRRCGVDMSNPKHLCPENVREMHDLYGRRVREAMERERARDAERMIADAEPAYARAKGRYFGLVLSKGDIVITVLHSVREFYEEGTAMHHCVFTNGYYRTKDSLIMSAKDADGKRLETIEFDLRNGTVLQSRGVCNQPTQYHDDIVGLVTENAKEILKLRRRRKAA